MVDDIRENTRVFGNILKTSKDVDYCIGECLNHPKCKSVNINEENSICELFNQSLSEIPISNITKEQGWTYYDFPIEVKFNIE